MTAYEITAEMNLKKIIAESREVAQAINEFADNLEQIERKYEKLQESESKRYAELAKSYVQGFRAGLAESEDKE